jgi:DNA primase
LKRFVKKVVLVYDGDAAGQKAAERAVERFVAQDVDLRIMTLPENKDPDEFLSTYGAEAWQTLAEEAPESWEYKFQTLRKRYTLNTINARQEVLDGMLALLAAAPRMASPVREGLYLANLAQRLGASEHQVRERYRDVRNQTARRVRVDAPTPVDEELTRLFSGQLTWDDKLECELLEAFLAAPEWIPALQPELTLKMIRHPHLRRLLGAFYDVANTDGAPSRDSLFLAIEDGALKRLAVWLDDDAQAKGMGEKLKDSVSRVNSPVSGSPRSADSADGAPQGVSPDGCPLLLRQLLENLQRREEQSHSRIAVQLSAQGDGMHRLDETAETLLRQAAEFHQRRATKKTSIGF